jgi:outer membrane protein TolC
MRPHEAPITRTLALVFAAAAATAPLSGEELSFPEALTRLHERNEAVQAAAAHEGQRAAERAAARGLYLPKLEAGARWTRIDEPIALDLAPIRQAMLSLHPNVPPALVPPFVQEFQAERFWKADLRLTWPVFTGGKTSAANRAAEARLTDAREERRQVEQALTSELVRRYFGVRLATRAHAVRRQLLEGLDQHLYQAKRLEEEGFISKAERLHAEVARAEAARQLRRAEEDQALAETALANSVASDEHVQASSPLFVSTRLEPLEAYLARAASQSPALARLGAAGELAHQATRAEKASFFPDVYLFGMRELVESDLTVLEPTWALGVGARVSLFEGGARAKRLLAARKQEERARLLRKKAERDIATLVERSWRQAREARDLFETLETSRELARENVRVRTRAFEEGVGTSLEVVDARLSLQRAELERLSAAYDFVVSLADLLEASGEAGRFEDVRAAADVEVER